MAHKTKVAFCFTQLRSKNKVYEVTCPKWMRRAFGRVQKRFGYSEGPQPTRYIFCGPDETVTRSSALHTFRVGEKEVME